jgi:hypothetical protein
MSEDGRPLSPVGDTIIDRAMLDVQVAFSTMNWKYAFDMLRKAVYETADEHIINECEEFMQQVNRERLRIKSQASYTVADQFTKKEFADDDYLKEQDYQFLKKFMLLLRPYLHYKYGPPTKSTGLKQLEEKLRTGVRP